MNCVRYIRCKRCNKLLKSENAQVLGYGSVCYQKMIREHKDNYLDLFTIIENKGDR